MCNDITKCIRAPGLVALFDNRPSLIQILSQLVDHLSDIGDGDTAVGPPEATIDRWSDADYVYLETDLPNLDGPEADVSIQSGHIFIRVARQVADEKANASQVD